MIQLCNGVPPSASLVSGDFTVEMETGTGKTCVYLRTIFDRNKRYGFTNRNQDLLRALGVSTPLIERLIQTAMAKGAQAVYQLQFAGSAKPGDLNRAIAS